MSWDDEDDDKPVSVLEDEDEKEHKGAQAQPPARIGSITQDAEEIPASIIGAHPSAMPKQQPSIAQQQTQSITGPAPAQTPPAGSITAGPLDHPGPAAQREQDLLGNKPEYHGWKKALDVLGRVTGLGRNIEEGTGLGTLGYEQRLAQAHRDAQREQALTMAPLQASYEQSRAGEENAKAEQERAKAEALTNPPAKPVKPEPLYDKAGNLIGFQVGDELIGPNSQKLTPDMKDMLQAAKPKPEKPEKQPEEERAISDYMAAHNLEDTPGNRDKARSVLKTRDRAPKDAELTDINKQIKQAQLEKLEEPTTDEQRRADLARNMRENLDSLEDIVNRRPELFGPVAGRYTQLRQAMGTGDPDVAKLKAIREYLGMASVGAHAMRNAQHVGEAADAVLSKFVNEPDAIKAAIEEGRKSTGTFLADEQKRKNRALEHTEAQPAETAAPKAESTKGFSVPKGAPAAPKEDGKVLKMDGKVIARSKGGQWVAPQTQSSP